MFQPHLDYRSIKASIQSGAMAVNLTNRNMNKNTDPARVVSLYDQRVALDFELADLRRLRNKNSADIAAAFKHDKQKQKEKQDNSSVSNSENALLLALQSNSESARFGSANNALAFAISQGKDLKDSITQKEHAVSLLDAQLYDEARHLPNDTCPMSPIGDQSKAVVLETVNAHIFSQSSAKSPKNHVDICIAHDIAEFTRASKISGSGFYILKNYGALLELALSRYAMDTLVQFHGFTPILVPDVIRHEVLEACGFSPRAGVQDPQTYFLKTHLDQGDAGGEYNPFRLCLAATAEFPLAAMHAGEALKPNELPIKYVGLGRAFRAEGLAGSANRGLYRVHQFSKVEMFGIVAGGSDGLHRSNTMMDEFKSIQKSLFEGLEICFRILDMPTEELGAPAYKKYDMEAWMPGRNSWGEISSTSNCTDYQARRLNIRHFRSTTDSSSTENNITGSNLGFVHTINGTAAAIPRLIIALLETHQQENGDVLIPEKLRPFILDGKVNFIKSGETLQQLIARIRS
ncbi:seryl-tRNA synthetase [Physocladia obscura]|uniref:serine--tRNA ligase n=1 Tax=Physocladia obscura TaxID=109957 RepID=A0AAD5XHN6_9FUNG|nr:seryl-tRNA synthetase [Physocladia obscura]